MSCGVPPLDSAREDILTTVPPFMMTSRFLAGSAIVKLVAPEEDTQALTAFLAEHRSHTTSVLGFVEVRRAAAR